MIAISYRREDSLPIAGRLYDRLQAKFGKENVFMDFDSIAAGVDFREQIKQTIERANLVIAIIGPHWLGERSDGSRRIDDPADFVRLELEYALKGGIPVIPLLINNTPMPKPEKLPPIIERLAFRNALPLDSGLDFHSHAERLISSVSAKVGPGKLDQTTQSSQPRSTRRKLRMTFVLLTILLAIGVIAWYLIPKPYLGDDSSKRAPANARESEGVVTTSAPLPGNLESTEQSPEGDIRVEYRRDLAGNPDLPGVVWLISTKNESKRLLLYRHVRGAQVIFSPNEQWLVVNDDHGSGQSIVQLFRRARADDIAYLVPTEVAGHNRPLGVLAWCFYWTELGGDTNNCGTGDPYHVYIHARAWRSDSSAVMLKIAVGGSESAYNAMTPYECWYDVNNQKFQSITNVDALRDEIQQARAHESPLPSAESTIVPTLPTSSPVKPIATQTHPPPGNAKKLFAGTWEGTVRSHWADPNLAKITSLNKPVFVRLTINEAETEVTWDYLTLRYMHKGDRILSCAQCGGGLSRTITLRQDGKTADYLEKVNGNTTNSGVFHKKN